MLLTVEYVSNIYRVCNVENLAATDSEITNKLHISLLTTPVIRKLAVCSDGITEASRGHSVRADKPASTLSAIMHTPLIIGAAVVWTRAPENEKNVGWKL